MTPPLSPRRTVPASEAERSAYNAAFHELGLGWHWSADTFESLQARGTPCDRIRHYMEQQHPHLFRAYDAEFLASAIACRLAELRRGDGAVGGSKQGPARHVGSVETQVAQIGF